MTVGAGGLPALELAFPGPDRDSGVAAILAGRKTALTGLLQILEHAAEPVPEPGQRFSVLDSVGQPAAVIELTEVRVARISAVDDEYARAEGRGYADAAEWHRAHEEFFRSEGIAEFLGATPVIDEATLVVTERFHGGPHGAGPRPARTEPSRVLPLIYVNDGGLIEMSVCCAPSRIYSLALLPSGCSWEG
jgi:uncharacterized protein YhfF